MNKVLVTGVNGFVGQHLAKELSENGAEVIGVGGPRGATETSPYLSKYYVVDLMDRRATEDLDFSEIDSVVHLAGLASVGPSFDDPMKYITTNMSLEANLFEVALKQNKKPRFLIVSTGGVYDPSTPLPLTEESKVTPSSPYAVSKLGQEQLAQYYNRRGFEVLIARPFNHIGPGQGLGFIVPDLTEQVLAIANGKSAELKVGNLDAKRDYTDVRDIVCAYRLLLEKGHDGETYNICSGVSRSGNELLSLITEAAGVTPKIALDPAKMRPSDTPDIYGSHEKVTQATGWQPKIALEQTIKDAVEDWRTR